MKLGNCWILPVIFATCIIGCEKKAGQPPRGVSVTKVNIRMFHQAVVQFKNDTGRYPTEQEGLMALIKRPADVTGWRPGGYLQMTDLPKDNWDNDFVYKYDHFVIISYGADSKPGGAGDDADLSSADLY